MEKSKNSHRNLHPRKFGRGAIAALALTGTTLTPIAQSPNTPESANRLLIKAEQVAAAKLVESTLIKQAEPKAGEFFDDNWVGYAVNANPGQKFNKVASEFIVPRLACPVGPAKGMELHGASMWVGIDGFTAFGSSKEVDQVGLNELCFGYNSSTKHQQPYYNLFYETWPDKPVFVSAVKPGDTISVAVDYSAGDYTFSINDLSTNKPHTSKPQPCVEQGGCTNTTAEWIEERNYPILADFNTIVFHDSIAATTKTAVPLGDYLRTNRYDMIADTQQNVPIAVPSPVTSNEVFSVSWRG